MSKDASVYQSPAYRRSRHAYRLECTFEYFVALMVQGAFLATLLSRIGMSDATVGIVSSFISLAFLFQLCAIFVVQRIANTKRFVVGVHSVSQLLFGFLYVIPFLPFAYPYKATLVVISLLLAYFGNYLVASMIYKWGNSYVDPQHLASYTAGKEMLSLVTGIAVTLVTGYVVDHFAALEQQEKGFIFIAVAVFIYCVCDLVCLLLIKNEIRTPEERKAQSVPLRQVLRGTLCNRSFRHVVAVACLWSMAQYFTVGFLGTYETNAHELAFSLGTVQLMTIVGTLSRAAVSRPFGRFSDRFSYAKGAQLGFAIAMAAFLCLAFTTPSTRYLIVGFLLLYNVCCAGTNANMNNVIYHYVDNRYFVQAMAIKNSIGGLCGFGASLLASRLLHYVQSNGNRLFGLHVYGQQVLALISAVAALAAFLYVQLVLRRQTILK